MADHPSPIDPSILAEARAPYSRVFWVLLAVTVLEYGVARLPIPFVALVSVLTALATVYAFLVAWFFMHLKFEGRWIPLMLVPVGFLMVVVVVGLTPDIAYHQLGFYASTAVADR